MWNEMRNRFIIGLIVGTAVLVTVFRTSLWAMGAIAFFFFYELATIIIISKKNKTTLSRQFVNLFMGLKVGKFILSLSFVLIYAMTVKTELKNFLIAFAVLYLIYLAFDTFYFLFMGKKLKKEKENEKK